MLILLSVPPVPSGMEINFPSGAIQHFSALTWNANCQEFRFCCHGRFLHSQVNVKKLVEKIPTKLGSWFSNHWDVHFKKNNYYHKVPIRNSWNSTLKKICKKKTKNRNFRTCFSPFRKCSNLRVAEKNFVVIVVFLKMYISMIRKPPLFALWDFFLPFSLYFPIFTWLLRLSPWKLNVFARWVLRGIYVRVKGWFRVKWS